MKFTPTYYKLQYSKQQLICEVMWDYIKLILKKNMTSLTFCRFDAYGCNDRQYVITNLSGAEMDV